VRLGKIIKTAPEKPSGDCPSRRYYVFRADILKINSNMNFFYFLLAVATICIALFIKIKMPLWIGRSGERFVNRSLERLDPAHYMILNDIMLPSAGSLSATQIDHLVVSNYGIFCIETKAYKGWIFGDSNQEYWTQVIYRYKTRFYNPLRQNYAHTKAIEDLLISQYPNLKVISLVVFPYAGKLKISGTDLVGYMRDIVKKIESFNYVVFPDAQRDEIYKILADTNIQDRGARKTHDKGVRDLRAARKA